MARGWLLLLCLARVGAASAQELRDIRGPVALSTLPPFLLTGAVLLLLGGLLLWQRKPRARWPTPANTTPATPAHIQLEQLAADFRRGACSGSELITRLDTLLRATIAARTGLPASRLTSQELLAAATLAHLDDASLAPLLTLLDQSKFTGQPPTREAVEQALSWVAAFIGVSRADKTP